MIKKIVISSIILSISYLASYGDIKDFFPKSSNNWQLTDSVKVFVGDDLFTYIDGGAEIFIEYGFKQVATVNYMNASQEQLQAEIYEMSDSAAAYGAYTFYLNGEAKPLNVGLAGVFIEYFSAFVKGNYLIVLSASNSNESLFNDCQKISEAIGVNIKSFFGKPELVSKIEKTGFSKGHIKYLEGNVGLSNVYKFIPGNAFSFQEGVSYKNNEGQVIIMKFSAEKNAKTVLENALAKLQEANKETSFSKIDNGFTFSDYRSNYVNCSLYKNYIIIEIVASKENLGGGLKNISKVL